MGAVVIFCTVPNKDEAKKISKALLNENLAACCSTVDKISSMFSWNGEICIWGQLGCLGRSAIRSGCSGAERYLQ